MGWLSVELSSSTIDMKLSDIKQLLLSSCPGAEIFVPITEEVDISGQTITTVLCEGYAFIKHFDGINLSKLQRCSIVLSILSETKHGRLVPAIISDDKIERMRSQLVDVVSNKITEKSKVLVLSGLYSGLTGHVITIIDTEAIIKIQEVKSKTILATVPLGGIKLVDE